MFYTDSYFFYASTCFFGNDQKKPGRHEVRRNARSRRISDIDSCNNQPFLLILTSSILNKNAPVMSRGVFLLQDEITMLHESRFDMVPHGVQIHPESFFSSRFDGSDEVGIPSYEDYLVDGVFGRHCRNVKPEFHIHTFLLEVRFPFSADILLPSRKRQFSEPERKPLKFCDVFQVFYL